MVTVRKVQRWSPDTCQCVIEQYVDYDETGVAVNGPNFLLMNEICSKHEHMKSTEFKSNHAQLSGAVLQLIEDAKARNMKQVDDQVAFAKTRVKGRARMLRDLARNRVAVQQHNDDITEEWLELVSVPEAFDEHVHDVVLAENQAKNRQVVG